MVAKHNFGEKPVENIKGIDCPVWQTPKYELSRQKAIEMIDSGKYGLADGDFWILMKTYSGGKKCMYVGLIISHNGCLKINDTLDSKDKFYSRNLTRSLENGSLIYEYNDGELYEVGEVSKENCDNSYPYAMAFKRCFDRVVLKKSKLAFYGVYSEEEADEFRQQEPREEYKNSEISTGTYRRFIDLYFTQFPNELPGILKKYKIDRIDQLDEVVTLAQLDEILTKLKAKLEKMDGNGDTF